MIVKNKYKISHDLWDYYPKPLKSLINNAVRKVINKFERSKKAKTINQ